jgi:hypothetical protein
MSVALPLTQHPTERDFLKRDYTVVFSARMYPCSEFDLPVSLNEASGDLVSVISNGFGLKHKGAQHSNSQTLKSLLTSSGIEIAILDGKNFVEHGSTPDQYRTSYRNVSAWLDAWTRSGASGHLECGLFSSKRVLIWSTGPSLGFS